MLDNHVNLDNTYWNNECKEILLVSDPSKVGDDILISTINFSRGGIQKYESSILKEQNSQSNYADTGRYIYDPNTAIRKAGLFHSISKDFNLNKLSSNSHLYFSDTLSRRFPGRIFELNDRIPFHKFLKKPKYEKANIAVRNFPLTVSEIRKKSGVKEGGDLYIFGTTDHLKNAFFILARKVDWNKTSFIRWIRYKNPELKYSGFNDKVIIIGKEI